MGQLGSLLQSTVAHNQLTGTIPVELGDLSLLEVLYLDSNQLSGPSRVELSTLSNLRSFSLDDNQLSGSIPAELGNVSNLVDPLAVRQPVERVDPA